MESTVLLPANPAANYLAHKEEIDEAVRGVLESGMFILGPEVGSFEQEFAAFLGAQDVVGVGSGTEAIHLALRACGVGDGDLVATVSHTAVATVAAVSLAGAIPVLVDVDPDTATIDVNCLEDALKTTRGPGIKAILVVHLYGRPADMPSVMDLADRYGLIVIEDCAQSHGATINGRQTGTWGQMAAFSFYPTKNLGALGDAGAVATSDRRLAERARLLREYGWKERYVSSIQGMNTRLDEIQAAILRVKLRYLARENDRRRKLARLYDSTLRETDVKTPPVQPGIDHVYHQYVIQSDRRDELRDRLEARHIRTLIHYPVPIHLQPAYRGNVHVAKSGLTRTESLCRRILSLPMHPHLDDEQVREVAGAIAQGPQ